LAPEVGLEPTTYRLTAGCSTIELLWNIFETSDDLLSQAVSRQVPSALKGLTSVFGMGTGVSPSLLSLDFQDKIYVSIFSSLCQLKLFVSLSSDKYYITTFLALCQLPFAESGFRNQRRPTLPGSLPPSTISAEGLNFCVRYGYRCFPFAFVTGYILSKLNKESFWSSPRPISIGQLKTLLPLHLRPIYQMVFLGSYPRTQFILQVWFMLYLFFLIVWVCIPLLII
jgi:hypothetical protein